jgi:hypothetical protein
MADEEKTTDEIGKKLDLADSWLTKFGNILKKHWGKLLFLLFCYCVYWAFTQPPTKAEAEQPQTEDQVQEQFYQVDSSAYWDSIHKADSLKTY